MHYGQTLGFVGYNNILNKSNTDPQHNTIDITFSYASDMKASLILFNEHNGYYRHSTMLKWHGLEDDSNDI